MTDLTPSRTTAPRLQVGAGLILVVATAAPALADPCTAIPDRGPMPGWLHKGATFNGTVPYVGDGDSLCIEVTRPFSARAPRGSNWVEVRLADVYAPERHEPAGLDAKRRLEQVVAGRRLTCVADHRSHDRMVARCTINGISVGDRLRQAGGVEGGRGRQGRDTRR
jgi:micrococcal nuclease